MLHLKKKLRSLYNKFSIFFGLNYFEDFMLRKTFLEIAKDHVNPLNNGKIVGFSQCDEDSITIEILKRIKINKGRFIEFGVGNGIENNTLILLALGWKGMWFGGEELILNPNNSNKLRFKKTWITVNNIYELFQSCSFIPDVISIDLDGNDLFLVENLLQNKARPKLFIVEINPKFPPPIEFTINYDENHIWSKGDYFGASLSSFNNLFKKYNYKLICCSISGSNAFFIDISLENYFNDCPQEIEKIYCPPFPFIPRKNKVALKTIQKLIN